MTFFKERSTIQEGDLVIVYVSPHEIKAVEVKKDESFINRVGTFECDKMIGLPFGTKFYGKNDKGFVYLMYPTPEWWTLALPHRTQILYHPDISFVSSMLELKPGVHMIEAGTGSGSFTHSIARSIAPTGRLFSFEYHPERAEKAKSEFQLHGLDEFVTLQHRDVCQDGFGLENTVTAIFLDLPSPWIALEHAKRAMKKDRIGRICCFSPCIEQVQKTCLKLKELAFVEIKMFECLVRSYDVRRVPLESLPTSSDSKPKDHGKKKRSAPSDETTSELESIPQILGTKPVDEVRGHTSFLTFATLLPSPASS